MPPLASSPSLSSLSSSTGYAGVEVVAYGGGNVGSVLRALERLGIAYTVCQQGSELTGTLPLVLPGVGAFGALMQALEARGHKARLLELLQAGQVPFLGICVGLQVLFEGSEESPEAQGLGWFKGHVRQLQGAKVPQIGWNEVRPQAPHEAWPQGYVYYVNSYVAHPQVLAANEGLVLYESTYEGQSFCGAVRQGLVTAFQFHPEKSGAFGHALLAQWWASC
jgi:glutamine amidotransferase/cyclase